MILVDMLFSESYSPLRTVGWTPPVQVDALSCEAACYPACIIVVFLSDLIISRISEDELRSWATINRGAFVLTR